MNPVDSIGYTPMMKYSFIHEKVYTTLIIMNDLCQGIFVPLPSKHNCDRMYDFDSIYILLFSLVL